MSDASDRRIVQGRIRRLELLLRLSSGDRARDLRQALDQLYVQVGKAPVRSDPVALMKDVAASAAGVNGVGGLRFEANAPPGIGRIVAIPLYLYEVDNQPTFPSNVNPNNPPGTGWTTVTTGAGALLPDEANPTVIVNIPPFATDGITANRKVTGLYFRSPILEWATVRIVGFQVSTKTCPLPEFIEDLPTVIPIPNGGPLNPNSVIPQLYTSNQRPTLLVRNLNVGGSANLFPQGEYVDATVYSTLLPEYAGLRDNPILASPNRAYLSAAVVGVPYTSMTFTIQLIVDILDDTEFGRHQPGPYARRGAQGRMPSIDSVSYVTR